jgi:glycosyltransferase involved in cell wall biosynthesis
MGILLDVMSQMSVPEVEFWIVGATSLSIPASLKNQPNIHWEGSVGRGDTWKYYQDADVFVFPSFSDGFGLTQLEAQAWKLPLVVSQYCGEVVHDGHNGVILQELSADALQTVIARFLSNPGELAEMSQHSSVGEKFSLATLGLQLVALSKDIVCSNR